MYHRFIQRYDFKRVSALKLEKNSQNPNDVNPKFDLHPERLRQVPLKAVKEHPDFTTTSKATYRGFTLEGKAPKQEMNSYLFQPDYAYNDNIVDTT